MKPKWTPPADFAEAIMGATLPELARRYNVNSVTITKYIRKLPERVQAKRWDWICEQRRTAGQRNRFTTETSAKARETLRKNRAVAARNRDPVDATNLSIRDATMAFEVHYCHVAERRGWAVRGYCGT
jgi:hypothetical protein